MHANDWVALRQSGGRELNPPPVDRNSASKPLHATDPAENITFSPDKRNN